MIRIRRFEIWMIMCFLSCLGAGQLMAQKANAKPRSQRPPLRYHGDIQYAEVDGHKLLLDLYLPNDVKNPPLLVWVHGGAWRGGSRSKMPLQYLVMHGYAVASVDYRLSPVAKFPALIHDCKAAIRFLRAHQKKYGYNAKRIGIAGSSAGGHMVALIGVSNGHKHLEGTVGQHLDQSSDVHAIVDYYGPTNFMTILKQSTPHGLSVRVPALKLLLGDRPEVKTELAKLASPVTHVDANDPPLLLIHGDQDPQVPINQAHELHGLYKKHKLEVLFEVIHGGAHGGKQFHDAKRAQLVKSFIDKHVRQIPKPSGEPASK
jgi:acetyl esterase/lipase